MAFAGAGGRKVRSLKSFLRAEAGGLTVFSLFVILMMLMAGGLAVDFMRQETARVRLQSTLDRAILAAADMGQTLEPRAVVADYFAKAGLSDYLLDVDVTDTINSRRVVARTATKLDPYFLGLVGIHEMDVPANGTAEESTSNIEISLVLDVSGSMGQNNKLEHLKVAAKEFVDTIYAQTDPGRTTISIVPYNTQVNAGAGLLSHFSVSAEHNYSSCVDFTDAAYDAAALPTTVMLQRTGHFDPTARDTQRSPSNWVCNTAAFSEVLPVSSSTTALKAKIDSLVAGGYTSIDVGVKWGAALLDPSTRPAIDGLIADGAVAGSNAGHPLNYSPETLKVVVVMTDGINTSQWYLDPRYRSGLSDVWLDRGTNRVSVKYPEVGDRDGDGVLLEQYYIPATGRWDNAPSGGAAAVQLTYPELWANTSVRYNARQMSNASGLTATFRLWTDGLIDAVTGLFTPGVFSSIEGADKDARLGRICTATKAQGIRVYSIGFEVTNESAAVMQGCATTPSHFFRVNDEEIVEAFRAIANDIGKLRLTQ